MDEEYMEHQQMVQINTMIQTIHDTTIAISNGFTALNAAMSNMHMLLHVLTDDSDSGPTYYIDADNDGDDPIN